MTAINCMAIVAHPDDECLSAGGYIQSRIASGAIVVVLCVFGRVYNYGEGEQYAEAQQYAFRKACKVLGASASQCLDLPEGEPNKQSYYTVLKYLEIALNGIRPEEVVIHDNQDRNQDHRWLHEVCQIALRPWANPRLKLVLGMQSPDGMPKVTNYYVPVAESQHKTQMLALESYAQETRDGAHPRSPVNLDAWQRVHGSYCNEVRAEPFRLIYAKD